MLQRLLSIFPTRFFLPPILKEDSLSMQLRSLSFLFPFIGYKVDVYGNDVRFIVAVKGIFDTVDLQV